MTRNMGILDKLKGMAKGAWGARKAANPSGKRTKPSSSKERQERFRDVDREDR